MYDDTYQDTDNGSDGDGAVEVLLLGGPTDIPDAMRSRRAVVSCGKIKMPHAGGYEHFELVDPPAGPIDRFVFRWTMRTAIAE